MVSEKASESDRLGAAPAGGSSWAGARLGEPIFNMRSLREAVAASRIANGETRGAGAGRPDVDKGIQAAGRADAPDRGPIRAAAPVEPAGASPEAARASAPGAGAPPRDGMAAAQAPAPDDGDPARKGTGEARNPAARGRGKTGRLRALQRRAMSALEALLSHENEKVRLEAARFLLSERLKRDAARTGGGAKTVREINFTWFD